MMHEHTEAVGRGRGETCRQGEKMRFIRRTTDVYVVLGAVADDCKVAGHRDYEKCVGW